MGVHRDVDGARRRVRRAAAVVSVGLLATGAGLMGVGSVGASGADVVVAVGEPPDDAGPGREWTGPVHLAEHLRVALAPLIEAGVLTEEQVDAVVEVMLAAVEADRAERMEQRMAERAERMEQRMERRAERMEQRMERRGERMPGRGPGAGGG